MRRTVKTFIPNSMRAPLRSAYLAVRRVPGLPAVYLHPWRRTSLTRLRDLRGRYQGRRAFIIGNGPSLKETDLSRLRDEYTFGLNRVFLMFPKLGFSTSCLVSVNDLVIEQSASQMEQLGIPQFFSWHSRRYCSVGRGTQDTPTFLYTTYESPAFAKDVRGRVWEGATVTYVALQLAFHMGFQQVALVGVDHNFASKGKANTTVVSGGEDRDHFSPEYFGKGFRWQLPDLETSEIAYTMAREAFHKAGREVIDATVGGRLRVFPKVDYGSLFR
jgi:hypothetical protein